MATAGDDDVTVGHHAYDSGQFDDADEPEYAPPGDTVVWTPGNKPVPAFNDPPIESGQQEDTLTACLRAAQLSILSVGSGDGSQQAAIIKAGHTNITTTFYDTKSQLLKKYPESSQTISFLQSNKRSPPPLYGVDATRIHEYNLGKKFDLVMFTFPHTGVPNKSRNNISSNQRLLQSFLKAAPQVLTPDGEIQITLKSGDHYEKWQLPSLLSCSNLEYKGSHELDKSLFPGYVHRLTTGANGALKKVPESKKGAKVHVFSRTSSPAAATTTTMAGKHVTIIEPQGNVLPDCEMRAEIVSILSGWSGPLPTVLDIRRCFDLDPLPETRQLNRVLYQMEANKFVERVDPPNNKGKPKWQSL